MTGLPVESVVQACSLVHASELAWALEHVRGGTAVAQNSNHRGANSLIKHFRAEHTEASGAPRLGPSGCRQAP